MKQLLLRVPDELHERLSNRARAEGRSINALATETLERIPGGALTAKEIIRVRAKAEGILVTTGRGRLDAPSIAQVRETFRGVTSSADELLDEQRGGAR
jgi:HicB family